jgi:hypothetical protein
MNWRTTWGESLPYAGRISRRQTITLPTSWLSTSARPPHNHVTTFRVLPYTTLRFRCLFLPDSDEIYHNLEPESRNKWVILSNYNFLITKTEGNKCNSGVALIRFLTNTLFLSFAELSPSQHLVLHACPVFWLEKHLQPCLLCTHGTHNGDNFFLLPPPPSSETLLTSKEFFFLTQSKRIPQ